jgi:hypothetical protein
VFRSVLATVARLASCSTNVPSRCGGGDQRADQPHQRLGVAPDRGEPRAGAEHGQDDEPADHDERDDDGGVM